MRVKLSETGKSVYDDEPENPHGITGTIDANYTPWDNEFIVCVRWDNGEVNSYRDCDLEMI
jgi:hypothetical protein